MTISGIIIIPDNRKKEREKIYNQLPKVKERNRIFYQKNKERLKLESNKYYHKNKEELLRKQRIYNQSPKGIAARHAREAKHKLFNKKPITTVENES